MSLKYQPFERCVTKLGIMFFRESCIHLISCYLLHSNFKIVGMNHSSHWYKHDTYCQLFLLLQILIEIFVLSYIDLYYTMYFESCSLHKCKKMNGFQTYLDFTISTSEMLIFVNINSPCTYIAFH